MHCFTQDHSQKHPEANDLETRKCIPFENTLDREHRSILARSMTDTNNDRGTKRTADMANKAEVSL
jgi:hypothetical protein